MTRGEDQLRTLLQTVAPPADPVHFEEIARRVSRRRTTIWSGAAAVTVLVIAAAATLAGLAGIGRSAAPVPTLHRTGQHQPAAVPWISTPAPHGRHLPKPHRTAVAADASPCTAANLRAAQSGRDGAGGHSAYYIDLRNTGTTPCLLQGYPASVVASAPGGPDVTGTDGTFFPVPRTSNIAPGKSASLVIQTDALCQDRPGGGPTRPPYHRLRIDLPHGGGSVPVRTSDALDLTCGLRIGKFYVEQPPLAEPKDPLRVLKVALQLPRSVARGTALVYRVRLTNPTTHAVSLDPCPGYLEDLSEAAVTSLGHQYVKVTYALNCAPVQTIKPRSSVWFAIQLSVPANAPAGRYQVDWDLLGAQLLAVHQQGTLMVTAP